MILFIYLFVCWIKHLPVHDFAIKLYSHKVTEIKQCSEPAIKPEIIMSAFFSS